MTDTLTTPVEAPLDAAEATKVAVLAASAVAAKAALEAAKAAYAVAEADAIAALAAAGGTTTLPDGTKVTAEGLTEVRRTLDAEALAERVTAKVLDTLTERKVVLKRFDAAVELGTIDADVVAAVVSTTPVKPSLRITPAVAS